MQKMQTPGSSAWLLWQLLQKKLSCPMCNDDTRMPLGWSKLLSIPCPWSIYKPSTQRGDWEMGSSVAQGCTSDFKNITSESCVPLASSSPTSMALWWNQGWLMFDMNRIKSTGQRENRMGFHMMDVHGGNKSDILVFQSQIEFFNKI